MIHQIPDYKLQPEDCLECPECGEQSFVNGYCSACRYDQDFEAMCDEYDNREKLDI